MDFSQAVQTCLKKYVDFSGRAQRSEYWFWVLFLFICSLALGILFALVAVDLRPILILATFLPGLAVSVRRLHDIDRSGWWMLLSFIPLIGPIIILIWMCTKGTLGDNRFGPDPLQNVVIPPADQL
jgi:uncharacterized membrane protein YhaH (DUF805 family)